MIYKIIISTFCLITLNLSAQADIDSLKRIQKSPALSLLPNISYSQNTGLNIGFSLSNISRFFQQKRRNQIELAKHINSIEERKIREAEKLDESLLKFQVDFENSLADFEALKIESQIFEIANGQYQAQELTTEEFLPKKLNWIRRYNSLVARCKSLHLRGLKISKQTPLPQLVELQNLIELLKEKNFGSLRAGPQALRNEKTASVGGLALSFGLSLQAVPDKSNLQKNVELP